MHKSDTCIGYYIRTINENPLYLTCFERQSTIRMNSPVGSLLPSLTTIKDHCMSFDSLCEAKAVFSLFENVVDLNASEILDFKFCLCMYSKMSKAELGIIARTA